ncbi:asparagine synthase (glutamine-hydrolyzing) [Nafulsella turpanensis]|uniref:asparagine synthase (glutamine-hydrolyzing) n=1 Tax=Nafulsella turpanensis TaxID=1265690 RepID=UPI0003499D45|nr:asparagine synthase (glutamine-hydrolyzing) [Nafulsella turpanensis]
MCGVNLVLDRKGQLKTDEAIRRMNAATRHRGPDAEDYVRLPDTHSTQLFIGSNRLKILDLGELGNQPMQCGEQGQAGERFTLSYNGELYNFPELKNELLQKGFTFRTRTDTEVILYALAEWGEAALPRFRGMFALAFYDQQTGSLLLARDRHGMKPLYYFNNESYLLVSSELRGLLASGLVPKILNEQQVYHYLQFKHAQKPFTFFQQVFELLPGHRLKWTAGQPDIEISAWPQPALPQITDYSPAALLENLEERLTDALFTHLQSDRPVGLFLSGGVDSTLMLALLQKNGSQLPLCFTISNSQEEARWGTQDFLWAEKAANHYGVAHFPLEIGESLLEEFPSFASTQDQPIGDGAAWLTALLSRQAQKRVQVVMSGAGADELFGGYNRHQAFYAYLKHYQKLQWLLPALRPTAGLIPPGLIPPLRKPFRLWKKLLNDLTPSPAQTFSNFVSFQFQDGLRQAELHNSSCNFTEGWMQSALQYDRQQYLVSDILALSDKASMQHSVEMRMPFLSEEVAPFAEALPPSVLMEKGRKWLLAEMLQNNGGRGYAQRKKEGFGLPFGLWVRKGKTDHLWQWLSDKNHPLQAFVESEKIQQLLQLHKSGKEDFSQELFSLLTLAHWLDHQFS